MPNFDKLLLPYAYVMSALAADGGKNCFMNDYNPTVDYSKNSNPTPEEDRMKAKGLTKFSYEDGFEVWAINRKNADKKYFRHLIDECFDYSDQELIKRHKSK